MRRLGGLVNLAVSTDIHAVFLGTCNAWPALRLCIGENGIRSWTRSVCSAL